MLVRKARIKDVPTILKMWKEFMRDHDKIVLKKNPKLRPYALKKKNAASIFEKYIKKQIRSKNSLVLIAEIDDEPAGYCLSLIKPTVPIFELRKIGHISDLFVRKKFRGRGISSRFKEESVRWFKKKGMKHMSIKVHMDNEKAHNIYKRWGFFDYDLEMRRKI